MISIRVCVACGDTFRKMDKAGGKRLYCADCRNQKHANKTKLMKCTCLICGVEFAFNGQQKFCAIHMRQQKIHRQNLRNKEAREQRKLQKREYKKKVEKGIINPEVMKAIDAKLFERTKHKPKTTWFSKPDREEIERHTKEFLKSGNKIKKVDEVAVAMNPINLNRINPKNPFEAFEYLSDLGIEE